MKILMIAAATTASMIGSVAFADVQNMAPAAKTYTICAEEARFGWKLSGTPGSTFTDHAANKAIGQVIGDGNCQSGWTMVTDIDPRTTTSTSGTGMWSARQGAVTSTVAQDAGRITSSYQGFAPEVLKGRTNGAGDKWKLVEADGNGGGTYKVKRSGNTSRPVGTELHFTQQMLIDRDNRGGTGTTNEYWWRNFRYAASEDVTTTDQVVNSGVSVTRTRVMCPSVYDYTFVAPTGEAVAVVNGRVFPCTVKRSTVSSTRTNSRTVVLERSTGDKYVTPQ